MARQFHPDFFTKRHSGAGIPIAGGHAGTRLDNVRPWPRAAGERLRAGVVPRSQSYNDPQVSGAVVSNVLNPPALAIRSQCQKAARQVAQALRLRQRDTARAPGARQFFILAGPSGLWGVLGRIRNRTGPDPIPALDVWILSDFRRYGDGFGFAEGAPSHRFRVQGVHRALRYSGVLAFHVRATFGMRVCGRARGIRISNSQECAGNFIAGIGGDRDLILFSAAANGTPRKSPERENSILPRITQMGADERSICGEKMSLGRDTVEVMGVRVDRIDVGGLLARIAELVAAPGCALVNNVNIRACNLAFEQPEFRRILNESAAVFCDGYGVKWGAALVGKRLGQRMTPPDWVDDLFARGVERGWSFFFVGDETPVVEAFARAAVERHPGLRIAGTHHGFFEIGGPEDIELTDRLRAHRPDVIVTGMGMPRQEYWADRARRALDHGVIIAAGALFRWYTGIERRAPRWMSANGLEWLYRLLKHPVRNFRRYVIGIPLFYARLFLGMPRNKGVIQGNQPVDHGF